ncbi:MULTISPECIES: hypothetical protein [Acidithiobacillus]|jgi:hypothetical protein|uniref:Lipoprotein n=3 Tax=Acidithiobacillus caldus TaxID=33059 RepID=F9ZTG8_ACICS|nr:MULTISPECIES: hypothetical protein [Acidithiobacillus]AEK59329.1 conserved hypothetical protein [Acidithiobacillus caldus SM-1]AIA56373.1 hypothetical protein Acaty_c2529 [Acidithiobacillus caldus ATCC 51756]AUW33709.1 hypothetical protein A5904_12970 [Acidithiobacillus caldus]MBU2731109.1 hypothetical protein [Acidithiobacillus caldus]MBU2735404.1 hypothetical protein [Acidithiobacillus caldus ATCC 51756]
MKKTLVGMFGALCLSAALTGCSSAIAPQINPIPYYTYYPASLAVVTQAAERALPAAGMQFSGVKTVDARTTEVRGYTSSGDAILITLHSEGAAVTKFSAKIGLYGHLREVQEIEHWMGKYVGEAIARPN